MQTTDPAVATDQPIELRWTDHAVIDVGLATIVAYCEKRVPEEVTWKDLDAFVGYAQSALLTRAMRSHASVLFTINTSYLNPSAKETERPRRLRELLDSYRR